MDYKNFDFSSLKYSDPKISSSGIQSVFINDKNRNKIKITTPKCYLPFGISDYNGKLSLLMAIDDATYIGFLKQFDQMNIETAERNSDKWFKKSMSYETIVELYNPCYKHVNKKYPPNFKANIYLQNGSFEGIISDAEGNILDIKDITKGCHVVATIELMRVYFVGKDFGLTWKVVNLVVYPSNKLTGFAFQDDSEEEE